VTGSASAGGRRGLLERLAFTRAARRARAELVFEPAVYSYFPLRPGQRSVVCFHDTIAESFPRLVFPDRRSEWAWRAKSWLAARQATRVMTVSAASRDALAAAYRLPPGRIDVVTEGADARFRPAGDRAALERDLARLGVPRGRPFFLFVGGISPHKNLATLLDGFAGLLRDDDATLVLAGDRQAGGFLADSAALETKVRADERLRARVVWTGHVGEDDLVALYQGARALVLPSLLEGFGLPALEAMSCGIPVAASRAGALPEVVGEAGLLFEPTDATALASALRRLLRDDDLVATLSARALERAAGFSWARGAELAAESFAQALELAPALAPGGGRRR
jgi:glycosyltransferase involved in cell wall biosynthesis